MEMFSIVNDIVDEIVTCGRVFTVTQTHSTDRVEVEYHVKGILKTDPCIHRIVFVSVASWIGLHLPGLA